MGDGFLSPKSDIVFKLLFGDERSIDFLTDFLKSVLRLPAEDYEDVTIVDPHLLREYRGDKLGILDVKVTTKSKKIIDIEIQLQPSPELRERIVLYSAKMVAEQIGSSDDYSIIKHVISIMITNYPLIPDSAKYHHRFRLYDPEANVEFTDLIEVNTLELPKLPEVEDGTQLWAWMKFLTARSKEDLNMIAEANPQVKKAVVRLMEMSNDERTRMLIEAQQKLEWDIRARERGAREIGRNERNIEIAKNLLQIDVPIDKIIMATGLAHDEIEALKVN